MKLVSILSSSPSHKSSDKILSNQTAGCPTSDFVTTSNIIKYTSFRPQIPEELNRVVLSNQEG
jgi:hypothetical protein